MDALAITLALGYAYLVGAVPTAYLVGRWTRGIDLRRYGSGNVGASNAAQHVGKGAFVLVSAFDALVKGCGSVLVARALGQGLELQALAGLLAAIGHNWSPYIGFSGGRGLIVAVGSLLVLSLELAAVSLAVGVLLGRAFRNVALWSGIALLLLPFWAWLFREPPALMWYAAAALAFAVLKRLLSNPGAPAGDRGWREKLLPRLLFDRDTWKPGDWVSRTPHDAPPSSMGH